MGKFFTALQKSKTPIHERDKKDKVRLVSTQSQKKVEKKTSASLLNPVAPTQLDDDSFIEKKSAFPVQGNVKSAMGDLTESSPPSWKETSPGILEIRDPHISLIAYNKPHSPEAEQFRMLKTAILFPDKGEPPRTIMITSSTSGEGKSFVAANLAVSMANSIDEYVLLMDCDLRRPTIHKIFGLPDNTPGLSEYLTQGVPLSHVLKKIMLNKLTILPCGAPPPNPSELISSEQMKKMLKEVKSRYQDRYIIIDAPPPHLTAEANALARQVDAIIIVVKIGYSKKNALKDLVDAYGKEKILGVVKNYADKTNKYTYE
ncbi:exopolysaccharide/PEP-CTERM locus tyrosine autokinase [Desulfocicer vacuolatum DSM 3385]|uniref:Exopolysaccharide/PEP-CTERM locus tyrosine autokinase n=1 Tax=Desulfocicer vacuolatum DSM 3385 TaxID=1121400 RepID=A0A1W1ZQK0_9BACT|nr:polysaccharide biosynthesis tyrosine autokinase [Desulfocicer vacuolatum]SMC50543.1 exopolysaccharide/PEP-CTERM locus tyrosine autokinase [Desulfocicer vacuolatum DSM 3385]